jgi:hypothetical protein
LRFLAIDLAKNFAQNPSIRLFLEPPATISAKSKTPKTVSLSGGSLVNTFSFFQPFSFFLAPQILPQSQTQFPAIWKEDFF